ncbi:MAG: caspase family protein, partial [Candidatus Riflebacteria bacterium]|nr:caspase family protein [Candidatus Riflebacteria bacterium]
MKKMHFFRKKIFLSILLGLTIQYSVIFANEIPQEIKNLWVFSVGVLEWKNSTIFSSFPSQMRRDEKMIDILKKYNIPDPHIHYIQDHTATKNNVEREFSEFISTIPSEDTLLVYYCGHGWKSDNGREMYFATWDAGNGGIMGWSARSILNELNEKFTGKQVFLLADCCNCGYIVDALGKMTTQKKIAAVMSSRANQTST